MRVLFVAFYFPPAGGGGVQRTLKFCRYLPEFGIEVHVLAPDDPKWLARDEPLLDAIPPRTRVHRARFHGPPASVRGDVLAGASRRARLAFELRDAWTRALVPDKAVPWLATAIPKAASIVRREAIDVVLSTSPPPSSHLVALATARLTGRPWVADFRDSWLANPHRRYERAGVRLKRRVDARLAGAVTGGATALVAATEHIATELGALHAGARAKTHVVLNGCDFDEFDGLAYAPGERFVIVHAGAFFGRRTPRPFLGALRRLLEERPELEGRIVARFVGDLRSADRAWARGLGIDDAWEETGFLPHRDSLAAQRAADALLLLIPDAGGRGDTVLSGKVFEYVAAGRPILAAVPRRGAAAQLIEELGAGVVVDGEDEEGLAAALGAMVARHADGGLPDTPLDPAVCERLSRRTRAGELAAVLRSTVA